MAVHTTDTQAAHPTIAARTAAAEPISMQRSGADLAVRAQTRCTQRPSRGRLDGIRAAASVMGWVLWLLLALVTAAFLTFAPWLF